MSPPLPHAQAAIFDLDGTLLDTLGDLADAVNGALLARGYPQHSEQAIRSFIGDGAEMLIRRAMPAAAGELAPLRAECLGSFETIYAEHFADRTRPYEGIDHLLAALRDRQVPLGILSNKPHAFTLKCVAAFFGNGGETFQAVLGQRQGVPKKPDPTGAVEAAGLLGVEASACLYVGDSGVDRQTALAAGMIPIGVSWGFRSADELSREGAAAVIDSPADLLAAFA